MGGLGKNAPRWVLACILLILCTCQPDPGSAHGAFTNGDDMASPKDILKQIADNEVKFLDFRFTDTVGREHQVSVPTTAVAEDKLESGQAFDGSSIPGWKGIEASDIRTSPDLDTANPEHAPQNT